MKIADFFVQITAKGDIKELREVLEIQKILKAHSKQAIAEAKVKEQQLKKETAQINAQAKQEAKKPKTLKEYFIEQGKIFNQQSKINMLIAKGVAQTALMKSGISGLAMAFVGATLVVDKMVMKLAQANQLYTNFQRQTGLSMRGAMSISSAMANLDVTMSPEEVMQNIQNLQSNLVGIQFGQGNIAPYQMAGINPFGLNPENLLDTIRRQMKGFAPRYRTYLLQQMGLDPRLGALIDLSDEEYAQIKKEQSMLYLDPQVRKDIQIIGREVNKLFLMIKKMSDLITAILGHVFKPATAFLKMAVNSVNMILEAMAKMPALLKAIEVIATAITVMIFKWWALLIPIIEDLASWATGGNSFFKELFEDPQRALGAVGDTFKEWFDNIIGEDFWGKLTKAISDGIRNVIKGKPNAEKIENAEGVPLWAKLLLGNSLGAETFKKSPFFLPMFTGSLLRNMGQNISNDYNKNLSMQNNIDIHVGSAEDGYKMVEPIQTAYNGIIAQMA